MVRNNIIYQPWDLISSAGKKKNSDMHDSSLFKKESLAPIITTQEVIAQRSQSFAYGTTKTTEKSKDPIVYPALLSKIAVELRQRIILSDHIKDEVEYKNTFDGRQVVDLISLIIQPTTSDRNLALRIGRELGSQRLFHDVCYETHLMDSPFYFYEFSNHHRTFYNLKTEAHKNNNLNPSGIITELTYCYVPTCWDVKPCYSPICPKRFTQLKLADNSKRKHSRLKEKSAANQLYDYWADRVDKILYDSLSKLERKRQENIYELIYTEQDYIQSLEYLQDMWIKPLTERPILPTSRREQFIQKVFGYIDDIYQVNIEMLRALQLRQNQHAIINQIGDVLINFVINFEPYIHYGSKQYEAKYVLENERYSNSNFNAFVENTERHPNSLKLELNGYLTKPTTRLGRYTLLLNEILKHTPPGHPDLENLPKAIDIIKQFLSRVNIETGKAKNKFDIERIYYNLSFKFRTDEVNLDLLDENRTIIKQGILKKSPQSDSIEYQVILLNNYLVIAKIKLINGTTEQYVIQKRPIPIEFLYVYFPDISLNSSKRSSALALTYLSTHHTIAVVPTTSVSTDIRPYLQQNTTKNQQYPITFQHLGRKTFTEYTLYATSAATRKLWLEKIQDEQEKKTNRSPIFELTPVIHAFNSLNKINHFITFNNGQQYLLAADDGVYVGHHNDKCPNVLPHKVLSIEKVTQIQVIESTETLLVLADRTLWEYPLDSVNGKPETQPKGRLVQNHVPFFNVGICLNRLMVCIPRVSALNSVITIYGTTIEQHTSKSATPQQNKRLSDAFSRWVSVYNKTLSSDELIHLKKIKNCYVPCEAYAIELSPTMMLITTSRGMIMVDMKTDHPQQLLNPADKNLAFILEREKEASSLNLRQPIKHIAIFRTPRNHYFVCYDEYAFYIDSKGNRLFVNFLIEWEGNPEGYAFCYPYVMAFDSTFIEIRNVITGTIEQVIRGKEIKCLNNGHKTELPLIFGSMMDENDRQFVFKLLLTANEQTNIGSNMPSSTLY
ncbi:uncharacterized protein BX663DRAFT_497013 [Cokeromyces recurvatus]|uniref:uncharacterized protein n=1 Tax=Cokeromyces recurvatus TaxID=90255 RepID=UPI00221E3C0A|nr:uncharacterized protein BX663DRAFT_497013 [Cokeromyces recurvatus]KAI7906587.1 hypothetical protein BX663DRAFT_497013 [Cokeromyces recurvatus]